MEIKCSYSELVDLVNLAPHPKNTNLHPENQVDLLARIMAYQGVRHPIIVSKRSGFIVAGHGRHLAAIKNGWTQFPVDYQDFENEAQEYLFLESDNHIAELAQHDKNKMIDHIKEFEIGEIDFDLIGIPGIENDLNIDLGETDFEDIDGSKKQDAKLCPHCGMEL